MTACFARTLNGSHMFEQTVCQVLYRLEVILFFFLFLCDINSFVHVKFWLAISLQVGT